MKNYFTLKSLQMKFFKTVFGLLLCSVIFSCTHEEEAPFSNPSIVGNWQLSAMEYTGVSKVSFNGVNNEHAFSGEASEIDFILDLSESPNTFTSEGGYLITLAFMMMGQEIKMPVRIDDFLGEGSWEINGDKLKVTSKGNPSDEMKILKLTEHELILEGDASRHVDESNALMSTTISATLRLNR